MSEGARPTALVVCPTVAPHDPPYSGSQKRILRLIEAMQRSGADPHVLAVGTVEDAAVAVLGERGIRLESMQAPARSLARRLRQHALRRPAPHVPALARRIAELVDRHRPAFVQIEAMQSAYYASARGTPTVLSAHSVGSEPVAMVARAMRPGTLGWLRQWNHWHAMRTTERRAVARADVVLCVSKHDAAAFSRVARQLVVVPNGADDELFEIDSELPDSESVLFFGTYGYEPNALGVARFLRDGWPVVAAARPNARLRLVGRGLRGELAAEAAAAKRVEAVGAVERLDRELARTRAVVVPIWHGGGMILKTLEGLAAARPIAATPFGVRDLGFVDQQHGLLADTPDALARAIVTLLEDRALSHSLAANGRALAERYRWSLATRPAERLYRGWVDVAMGRMRSRMSQPAASAS